MTTEQQRDASTGDDPAAPNDHGTGDSAADAGSESPEEGAAAMAAADDATVDTQK